MYFLLYNKIFGYNIFTETKTKWRWKMIYTLPLMISSLCCLFLGYKGKITRITPGSLTPEAIVFWCITWVTFLSLIVTTLLTKGNFFLEKVVVPFIIVGPSWVVLKSCQYSIRCFIRTFAIGWKNLPWVIRSLLLLGICVIAIFLITKMINNDIAEQYAIYFSIATIVVDSVAVFILRQEIIHSRQKENMSDWIYFLISGISILMCQFILKEDELFQNTAEYPAIYSIGCSLVIIHAIYKAKKTTSWGRFFLLIFYFFFYFFDFEHRFFKCRIFFC